MAASSAYLTAAREVVHEILAVFDEMEIVDYPTLVERVANEQAVVGVVVRHEDHD